MALLESVLSTCELEDYLEEFKNHDIDAFALKILTEEDLELLGITDLEKRQKLLEHAANLQIAYAEMPMDICFDQEKIQLVWSQMSSHLTQQIATLSIALHRKDIYACNIKLSRALESLENCLELFEKQLKTFHTTVMPRRRKKSTKLAISGLLITSLALLGTLGFCIYRFK